tara:strand:+ start:1946 stop:2182 length:237 start_codon:yes stop_codon:yes gene_type:complete
MSETKKEKFTRLAVRRVNKIAKQLEGIGNLGNSYQYESTQDERDRIEEYLTGKLEIQLKRLNDYARQSSITFDWDEEE